MAGILAAEVDEQARHGWWREYSDDYGLGNVLEAALDCFVQLGFHGTSVRTIAAKASLSVPGLYHHYRSKQELLATLLTLSGNEVLRRARAALAEAGPEPREQLLALVECIVLYMTHRQRFAHLQREIRCLDAEHRPKHIELRDTLEGLVKQAVNEATQTGDFLTRDPVGAARAVLTLCRGVADWYSPTGRQSPEAVAADYTKFCLALVMDRQV